MNRVKTSKKKKQKKKPFTWSDKRNSQKDLEQAKWYPQIASEFHVKMHEYDRQSNLDGVSWA